jgi:hypothetical protein
MTTEVEQARGGGWLTWRPLTRGGRLTAWAVVVAGVMAAGVSAYLSPDARGLGTHEQLYLPPCSMPAVLGIPCPLCGMTTAFALAARGRFAEAFFCQPVGLLAALAVAGAAIGSLGVLGAGRYPRIRMPERGAVKLILLAIAVVELAWAYKIWQTPYSKAPIPSQSRQLDSQRAPVIHSTPWLGDKHARRSLRE